MIALRTAPLLIAAAALVSAEARGERLDARWTKAAEAQYVPGAMAGKTKTLPELRVYDAGGRLILLQTGYHRGRVGASIEAAARLDRPVRGPSLAQSLAELETRDGKPLGRSLRTRRGLTVIDYWAEWCVPCKSLGAELDAWTASQPASAVTLVRAETDLMRALRAQGKVVKHYLEGPDGKRIEVED
jgi:thiol-disulfide isomerase/thioredoxin